MTRRKAPHPQTRRRRPSRRKAKNDISGLKAELERYLGGKLRP